VDYGEGAVVVFGLRKLFIAAISLAGVLAIYLLYSHISKTPPISVNPGDEFTSGAADSKTNELDGKIGKIGDVGVATLKKPKFLHRNKNKEVDREFGFDVLVHEEKDRWDIEKPYLNIFQPTFTCSITADRGKVQVETAVGRPTPKDATFTGNVVFHILPEGSSSVKEGILYLDEIAFLSEKTQFSTAGRVKFVSEGAQMLGTGLELIFNDQLQRLEFLRIIDLERLRIKSSQATLHPDAGTEVNEPPDAGKKTQPDQQDRSADSQKAQVLVQQGEGEYYKCICSKNVVIDTPEQLVFADQQVSINNIFWSRAAGSKSEAKTADTNDVKPQPADDGSVTKRSEPNELSQQVVDVVVTCDGGVVVTPMDSAGTQGNFDKLDVEPNIPGAKALPDFNAPAGRTTFVTRRIDYDASTGDAVANGPSALTFYASNAAGAEVNEARQRRVPVKITAQKETKFLSASNQAIFDGNCLCIMPQGNSPDRRDCTLSAPMLIVNLPKDKSKKSLPDVLASGPVELAFYVDDFGGTQTKKSALPAQVTARKQARFLAASNQIIFEDDCLCAMLREDPNFQGKYILSAQTLTVDLSARHSADLPQDLSVRSAADTNDRSSNPAAGIGHISAAGGVVRLATVKTAGKKLLGGIELKCRRFDYDAEAELFLAAGPGIIKVDNSGIPEPNTGPRGFSLRRPCYAFVKNFDTLKYFSKSNRITADARSQGTLRIDYIPIVKGKYGEQVVATANHIQADLVKAADGQTELSTIAASGGVTYEDDDNQFAGSQLFYDHNTSIIKVKGDRVQPCYFNGTLVDGIEYNLKTRKVKARVVGPGTLQIK
jgi:hypothetical protein